MLSNKAWVKGIYEQLSTYIYACIYVDMYVCMQFIKQLFYWEGMPTLPNVDNLIFF